MDKKFPIKNIAFLALAALIVIALLGSAAFYFATEPVEESNADRSQAYALDPKTLDNIHQEGLQQYQRQRYDEAESFFRKAATGGHAGAQFQLGKLYEMGHGLPKDGGSACYWYRIAADHGHAEARKALDRPLIKGKNGQDVTWEVENC